jgi:outer membrane protein assembly factor BamB
MRLPFFVCLAILITSARADWKQWRGPERTGIVAGEAWPASLSGLREIWRVPLGPSYSGPVMDARAVYTTESTDQEREVAHAIDRKTGKKLWSSDWPGYLSVPFFAKRNGNWIRATPTLDDGFLYVSGMQDVLVCLEASSGAVKWRVDFPKDHGAKQQGFGFVTSPLIDGDAIYTHAGAGLCRLKKATGALVWRSLDDEGGMSGGSFSSPMVATLRATRQLVVQGRKALVGLDLATGQEKWSQEIKAFRGMNIFTPIVQGNRIFTSAYGGLSQAWDHAASGAPSLAWEHKAEGYMSTPVVIAGKVFMHLRNQRFTCLDLATGVQNWVTDEKFGDYWSMIAQGDRILALDSNGTLRLIKANAQKFEVIDTKKLGDAEMWAHLALDGRTLVVRELNALIAYQWE